MKIFTIFKISKVKWQLINSKNHFPLIQEKRHSEAKITKKIIIRKRTKITFRSLSFIFFLKNLTLNLLPLKNLNKFISETKQNFIYLPYKENVYVCVGNRP